jgi:hypothetical protein
LSEQPTAIKKGEHSDLLIPNDKKRYDQCQLAQRDRFLSTSTLPIGALVGPCVDRRRILSQRLIAAFRSSCRSIILRR